MIASTRVSIFFFLLFLGDSGRGGDGVKGEGGSDDEEGERDGVRSGSGSTLYLLPLPLPSWGGSSLSSILLPGNQRNGDIGVFLFVRLFVCVYNSTRCILLFLYFISFHFTGSTTDCVIFGLLCVCHRIYVTRRSYSECRTLAHSVAWVRVRIDAADDVSTSTPKIDKRDCKIDDNVCNAIGFWVSWLGLICFFCCVLFDVIHPPTPVLYQVYIIDVVVVGVLRTMATFNPSSALSRTCWLAWDALDLRHMFMIASIWMSIFFFLFFLGDGGWGGGGVKGEGGSDDEEGERDGVCSGSGSTLYPLPSWGGSSSSSILLPGNTNEPVIWCFCVCSFVCLCVQFDTLYLVACVFHFISFLGYCATLGPMGNGHDRASQHSKTAQKSIYCHLQVNHP